MSVRPPRARLSRRRCLSLIGGACGASVVGPLALAHGSPQARCAALAGQQIAWLVGWSVGGGFDVYSRLVEPALERRLGAQIAVRNLPGASGLVAARRLADSAPDGRTLGILYGTGLMLAPHTNPGVAPDVLRDFTLLGRVVDHRQLLTVGPRLGVTSMRELREVGRERPLVFGSTGPTSMSVVLQAVIADLFGLRVELVLGFPGTQQLLPAVLRGDLDGTISAANTVLQVEELVPLLYLAPGQPGLAGPTFEVPNLFGRDGLFATEPDLFADSATAAADLAGLAGLLRVGRIAAAPAGLPAATTTCLRDALMSALADGDLAQHARRVGRFLNPAPASEVERHIHAAGAVLPRFADRIRVLVVGAGR